MTETPTWYFAKPGTHQKRREPVQKQYFEVADTIKDRLQALVREMVQNILDQPRTSGGSVRARILLSGANHALPAETVAPYFEGIWPHLEAMKCTASREDDCQFMVIEDFDTTGLTGNPEEVDETVNNDFYRFFRGEGISDKGSGKAGRAGVGKITIPMSSNTWSFFGITVREDRSYGDGCPLLFGQATMMYHKVEGETYDPDGWWGREEVEKPTLPIVDNDFVDRFRRDWHVSRKKDEPGLSIVIPYLAEPWTVQQVAEAIIEDYFVPVIQGQLSVVVEDLSGKKLTINDENLDELVAIIEDEATRKRLIRDIGAVRWGSTAVPIVLDYEIEGYPNWASVLGLIPAEQVHKMRDAREADGRVLVTIPVKVLPTNGNTGVIACLRIVLIEDDSQEAALFVRTGIVVKHASKTKIAGVRAIVIIDDPDLGNMLGDAENPAHTEWSSTAERFKGKYEYGPSTLTYIKLSPSKILSVINGAEDKADNTLAIDYFSVPVGDRPRPEGKVGPGTDGAGGAGEDGPVITPPAPQPPPPPTPRGLNLQQTSNGFKLMANTQKEAPAVSGASIHVGYTVGRGDPLKNWQPEDFTLNASGAGPCITLEEDGCRIEVSGNTITLEDIDTARFSLAATGFDTNRDLTVKWEETQ